MASLEQRLLAGLQAQDWRETASRGPWRRFGKLERDIALYVTQDSIGLWFSVTYKFEPIHPVVGPILESVLQAGDKQLAQERVDTEALLIELLYYNGGSDDRKG